MNVYIGIGLVSPPKRLADAVKVNSELLKREGSLSIYKVPLKEEKINITGCKLFHYGKEPKVVKSNRTIMVLGATGAGKSTLINGMINYILGVKWEDSFRFQIVDDGVIKSQAESQTSEVTVYKIHHEEDFAIDFSLTIVDTPGFGDTRGIERDREITEQLRNLFSAEHGVSEIDAVCFVAQASLARLTASQKYVFDSVLSIFGKDVAENIRILVTFAEGQIPLVLEAINVAEVPCPKENGLPMHFKFNNSALCADNKTSAADEDGGFDEMFWNMGSKSMKRFFVALSFIETKSLTLTKEVLRERNQLENSIENLQEQVKLGLAKLEHIRETQVILCTNEAEITRHKDFVIKTKVNRAFQEDISRTGLFLTNCQVCSFTCHGKCKYPNDKDKKRCSAMGSNGYCRQCPGKCYWKKHFNQKYRWIYKEVEVETTLVELKEKYQVAVGAKAPVQELIEKLNADYDRVQKDVAELVKASAQSLNRLKDIALKPNPLSTPEYIDMLIEGEKASAEPGWKKRVESLTTIRKNAELLAKVELGEKL